MFKKREPQRRTYLYLLLPIKITHQKETLHVNPQQFNRRFSFQLIKQY